MCVQIFIYIQFLFLFDFRYIVFVLLGVVVASHVKKVPYFSSIDFFISMRFVFFLDVRVGVCVCEPQRFCWLHLQLRAVTFVGFFVTPCHHDDDDDDIVDPLTQARTLPQISRDFWMT